MARRYRPRRSVPELSRSNTETFTADFGRPCPRHSPPIPLPTIITPKSGDGATSIAPRSRWIGGRKTISCDHQLRKMRQRHASATWAQQGTFDYGDDEFDSRYRVHTSCPGSGFMSTAKQTYQEAARGVEAIYRGSGWRLTSTSRAGAWARCPRLVRWSASEAPGPSWQSLAQVETASSPCCGRATLGRPFHRLVPDRAKKTRSIAAMRIVARKNRRDEGSR